MPEHQAEKLSEQNGCFLLTQHRREANRATKEKLESPNSARYFQPRLQSRH